MNRLILVSKPIQTGFQNIPVNLFSKSINHLLENDVIEIPDFKDETIATYGLKYTQKNQVVNQVIYFQLKLLRENLLEL